MKKNAMAVVMKLIKEEEGCHLHAYPDITSQMGKALGQTGVERVGRTGLIPERVTLMNGVPWTIGYGATGQGIRRGTKWTQEECDKRLLEDIEHHWGLALAIFPGFDKLHGNAQAALTDLVYNRGSQLSDKPGNDRRKEMRAIVPLVKSRDYAGIAEQIRSMKRLWPKLPGLLRRREKEALLVESQ